MCHQSSCAQALFLLLVQKRVMGNLVAICGMVLVAYNFLQMHSSSAEAEGAAFEPRLKSVAC